jgi:hypothetical protein
MTTCSPIARRRSHSGRPECANTGHSPTAWRSCQIDPSLPFKSRPMNGREAAESGLRLKVSVGPVAALPDPRDRLDSSIFSGKPSWSATLLRKTPTRKSCLRRKMVRRRLRFSACSRSHDRTSIPGKGANAPQNERSAAKAANRRRVRLRKVRASATIW